MTSHDAGLPKKNVHVLAFDVFVTEGVLEFNKAFSPKFPKSNKELKSKSKVGLYILF
jgi:hypothetical protein